MRTHTGIGFVVVLAALSVGCSAASVDLDTGATDESDLQAGSGSKNTASGGVIYGTIYGPDGPPVESGVVAEFSIGDYFVSKLIGSDGSYSVLTQRRGKGAARIYFGVLPGFDEPIELAADFYAADEPSRYDWQLSINDFGVPVLKRR